MCKCQRNGNYKKWKYFDLCLYNAIKKLHKIESFDKYRGIKLFSGLNEVQFMSEMENKLIYRSSYVSTSYNRNTALEFAKHNGMLMEFDSQVTEKFVCASLEWISKFPDECEILIARSTRATGIGIDSNDNGNNSMLKTGNASMLRICDTQFTAQKRYNNNNNNNGPQCSAKGTLQIVKVSVFDNNNDGLLRFESTEMSLWNNLFRNILLSKVNLLNMLKKDLNVKLSNEFIHGITKLYNSALFKKYLNEISKNDYVLQDKDLIEMQKSDAILKQFITDMSVVIFIGDSRTDMNNQVGCNGTILVNLNKMKRDAAEQFDLFLYCFEAIGEAFA